MDSPNLHAILISPPAESHLTSLLQLGTRLVTHHSLKVTVFIVTTPSYHPLLPPTDLFRIIHLPSVDISSQVDPYATIITQLYTIMRAAKPFIRTTLFDLTPRAHMLIIDMFGTESFTIAEEYNIPKYVYVPSTAWFTALSLYCPVLDRDIKGQYVDQTEPIRIPGCKPVRQEDLVEPMQDRDDQQYHEYVRMGIEFSQSDGILLNTWEDLELQTLHALRHDEILLSVSKAPIYTVGPLTKPVELDNQGDEIIAWLDKQPNQSVIYISFGGGGTLSTEQMTELAQGLELSQHRFVWVVRPPSDSHKDKAFPESSDGSHDFYYLPEGFLTRTKSFGIVVPKTAPQMSVLSHPAVGGFLSHCGWNSIIESLTNAVPMIAWPLYAEQMMNAAMLTDDIGVAIRPKLLPTKEVVRGEEVAAMITNLMESDEKGKAIREKAKSLKISAALALEEDGSSYNLMCQLIKDCQLRG